MQKKKANNNLKQIVFNTVLNKIKFTFFDHVTQYYYIGISTIQTIHKQDIDIENNREFQKNQIKRLISIPLQ